MDNGSKNRVREEIFNMEKESQDICNRERKKIQDNQANVLFKCCTYFTNHDITMNVFLQTPQLSRISNLWRWWCFFQNTTQLMSYSFMYSRDMLLKSCVQIRFLYRESYFKCAWESSLMDKTLKWIFCKVNNKALAPDPLFISMYEIKSWFVYVQVYVDVCLVFKNLRF